MEATELHSTTDWDLKPSLKYDALCILNALTDDPFYLSFYKAEYDHFNPLLTAEERQSVRLLKTILKDEGQGIVSAQLALFLSAAPDETLPEMIRTVHDSSAILSEIKKTPYWDEKDWSFYERSRPHLETALKALQRIGFPTYWEKKARPRIEKRIEELRPSLVRYNIVPAIEEKLGHPLSSNRITVYVLAYSEPHGIKITGTRFITHLSYPFRIVLHIAVHEMMHPPLDAQDPAVAAAIERLGKEPLIQDKVEHHDKSFGYNTVPGYIDEDSVQALEEIVCEQFGVQRDSRDYWKMQDDGMHILAVAIYVRYKRALQGAKLVGPFQMWLVDAVQRGELEGDQLADTLKTFFATSQ